VKLKSILTTALTTAAPIAANHFGGPGAAVLVASAVGSGAAVKKGGHWVEKKTGYAVHKTLSPVAAMGTPAVLATVLPPEWMEPVCEILLKLCDGPTATLGAAAGAVGLLWHVLSSGATNTIKRD